MPIIKIGRRTVASLPAVNKAIVYYDLKGFGLRTMPSGNFSWIIEYRPAAGGRADTTPFPPKFLSRSEIRIAVGLRCRRI